MIDVLIAAGSDLLSQVLIFLPKLLTFLIIVWAGSWIINKVVGLLEKYGGDFLKNAPFNVVKTIRIIAKFFLYVVAFETINVDLSFILGNMQIILTGVVFAVALAFGMSRNGQEYVGKLVDKLPVIK